MDPITIGAALVAGLSGSGHCLGMCGPMAALAGTSGRANPQRSKWRSFFGALTCNAGRITSYGLMGAVFGGASWAVGQNQWVMHWSQWLRIAAGLLLVVIGLQMLVARWARFNPLERAGSRMWRHIAPIAMRVRQSSLPGSTFVFGMLWGWLPCGLVYSMLALATLSGSAAQGALVMAAFGVGTLPVLLGVGSVSGLAQRLRRPEYRPALAALLMLSGVWLAAMPALHLTTPSDAHAHHHGP